MDPNASHGDRAHVPLPSDAPRGGSLPANRLGPARAASQAAAAVIAFAVAGGGVWFFGRTPPPPAASLPSLEMPASASPETAIPSIAAPPAAREDRSSSPLPRREGGSASSLTGFPEPPTLDAPPAEAAAAVPAEAARLSPGAASALFGGRAGGFTQWTNDHHSRPVTVSAAPAGGPTIQVTSAAKTPAPQPRTPSISELRAAAWINPDHTSIAQSRAAGWINPDHASIAQLRAASWISPDPPLPPPQKFVASGDCPDCKQAIASGGTHARPVNGLNGPSVGALQFEGRCKNGYIYRFTKSSDSELPSKLVSNDGEIWNVGKLAPGQSMVIRSNSELSQAAFTDL